MQKDFVKTLTSAYSRLNTIKCVIFQWRPSTNEQCFNRPMVIFYDYLSSKLWHCHSVTFRCSLRRGEIAIFDNVSRDIFQKQERNILHKILLKKMCCCTVSWCVIECYENGNPISVNYVHLSKYMSGKNFDSRIRAFAHATKKFVQCQTSNPPPYI